MNSYVLEILHIKQSSLYYKHFLSENEKILVSYNYLLTGNIEDTISFSTEKDIKSFIKDKKDNHQFIDTLAYVFFDSILTWKNGPLYKRYMSPKNEQLTAVLLLSGHKPDFEGLLKTFKEMVSEWD